MQVGESLRGVSCRWTFNEADASPAVAVGIDRTSFAFLMHNFRYEPAVTDLRGSVFLRFIGVFPFAPKP